MRLGYCYWGLFVLVLGLSLACDDILEQDISGQEPLLLAPAEGVTLHSGLVRFSWEPVSGAGGYLLQVATPDFTHARQIVLDTLVSKHFFDAGLPPGEYEWRLSAGNSAYFGPFASNNFTIDTTLYAAPLQLLSPEAGSEVNTYPTVFEWQAYPDAAYYILTVAGEETERYLSTQPSFAVALSMDFTYAWQVTALNEQTGLSVVSQAREFTLDRTAPAVPAYLLPLSDAVISVTADQIDFSWEDAVEEDFDHFKLHLYRQHEQEWVPVHLAESITSSEYILRPYEGSVFLAGTYLWRIQTVDRLGNLSPLTAPGYSFRIE